MKKALAVLIVALGIAALQAGAASAQELPQAFKDDITTLMKETGTEQLALQMGTSVMNQVVDLLMKRDSTMAGMDPAVADRLTAAVKDEAGKVMAEQMPQLLEQMVPVYARHFTHDEVKGLIAFYRSPVGKKFVKEAPALAQEGSTVGQAWGESLAPELASRIEARLKKEGLGGGR